VHGGGSNLKAEAESLELPRAVSVSEEEALKRGMEAKAQEFVEKGAEVCAKE
jgi:hypothetical protein